MTESGSQTRRAIFLDFDGTYADRGLIPPAHRQALQRVRAAGHLAMLCTGRPRSMVSADLVEQFDGLVCAAGGYVEVDGEVLRDLRFDPELSARAVRVLDEHGVAYLLEAPDAVHGRPGVDARLVHLIGNLLTSPEAGEEEGPKEILDALVMDDDLSAVRFGKITYFDSVEPPEALAAEIGPELGALPSSIPGMGHSAGELHLLGVHKALGIEAVMSHFDIAQDDIIAFGDGMNDFEMVQFAGVGVAIEGADPRLLAVADRTAGRPEEAGLVAAFDELGLY